MKQARKLISGAIVIIVLGLILFTLIHKPIDNNEILRCQDKIEEWKQENNCLDKYALPLEKNICFSQNSSEKHFESGLYDTRWDKCVLEYRTYTVQGYTSYVLFDVYNKEIIDSKVNDGESSGRKYDRKVKRLFDYNL